MLFVTSGLTTGVVRGGRTIAVFTVAVVTGVFVRQCDAFRVYIHTPVEAQEGVKVLAEALEQDLERTGRARPLLRISPAVWPEAAGVIVRLYKLGTPVAVESTWLHLLGAPLAATGMEDSVFLIVDRPTHVTLAGQAGHPILASHGRVFLHAERVRSGL
jgi:hypothetical protein